MKIRNYEKNIGITIIIIITLIIEIILFVYMMKTKIYSYQQLNTIVLKDNIVLSVVTKEERKQLYKNTRLFFKDKKVKYKIIEDKGVVITKDDEKYYEILLSFKFDKRYKSNDTIPVSLHDKKIRTIEIFKLIWDGD